MSLIFVTGGARSGKSSFAETRAHQIEREGVTYLATAQAFDDEMRARIGRHRSERPEVWTTVEEPLQVPEALSAAATPVTLLDCLSLWISNLIFMDLSDDDVLARVDDLIAAHRARGGTLIVVTNEVGLGIVPDNALARRYRDLLGWANQRVAHASDEAYLIVSGLSLQLK